MIVKSNIITGVSGQPVILCDWCLEPSNFIFSSAVLGFSIEPEKPFDICLTCLSLRAKFHQDKPKPDKLESRLERFEKQIRKERMAIMEIVKGHQKQRKEQSRKK